MNKQKRPNTAKADWNIFHLELSGEIPANPSFTDIKDVNNGIAFLAEKINNALDVACPPTDNPNRRNAPLPRYILDLIHDRNRLRNKYRRRPDPFIKSEINRLREEIFSLCKLHETETFNKKLSNLKVADNSLFKFTKVLTRARVNIPALKDKDGQIKFLSPNDKAKRFAEHYVEQISPHNDPQIPEFTHETNEKVKDFLEDPSLDNSFTETTTEELSSLLKKMKNNKAPGLDDINNQTLKKPT